MWRQRAAGRIGVGSSLFGRRESGDGGERADACCAALQVRSDVLGGAVAAAMRVTRAAERTQAEREVRPTR